MRRLQNIIQKYRCVLLFVARRMRMSRRVPQENGWATTSVGRARVETRERVFEKGILSEPYPNKQLSLYCINNLSSSPENNHKMGRLEPGNTQRIYHACRAHGCVGRKHIMVTTKEPAVKRLWEICNQWCAQQELSLALGLSKGCR